MSVDRSSKDSWHVYSVGSGRFQKKPNSSFGILSKKYWRLYLYFKDQYINTCEAGERDRLLSTKGKKKKEYTPINKNANYEKKMNKNKKKTGAEIVKKIDRQKRRKKERELLKIEWTLINVNE